MYNYETTIYGNSIDYNERVTLLEFKSIDIPDFVQGKDGWIRIVIDGSCDTVIRAETVTDYDIIPLDEY